MIKLKVLNLRTYGRTDQRTDGPTLLQRCKDASENDNDDDGDDDDDDDDDNDDNDNNDDDDDDQNL